MQSTEIIESLPDVVKFLMEKGSLTLAGGYIRDFFLGVKPKDIDLFGNVDKIVEMASLLHRHPWKSILNGYVAASEDKLVHTARFKEFPFPVQMVAIRPGAGELTPEEIIGRFDFTINQAAITLTSDKIITSERFLRDITARQLKYNEKSEPARGLGPTLNRVIKFTAKGFRIDPPSLARIVSQLTKTDYDALLLMLSQENYMLD